MTWYKTVKYKKLGFVQIIPPNWGVSYHFDWPGNLSRANQIAMTGPNSVVLFAQTRVCSLCNYFIFAATRFVYLFIIL